MSQAYDYMLGITTTITMVICPTTTNSTATTRPDGKPEASITVVVAPDDGHEDARSMLSCI